MSRVVIGMDPHKRSATIEIMAGDEFILGGGRFATDTAGYAAMLARVRPWPERNCDLAGLDMSQVRLEGAGTRNAKLPS